MTRHSKGRTGNRLGREGFVLPTGLFALILMTVLMVAALQLGLDERRSTRGMRESGVALYVAEAGMARTVGTWPAGAAALNPGDSLNLGWTTLSNFSKYRAVLHRVDGGTPTRMYNIMIEGIGAGGLAGRANLTGLVTEIVTVGYGVASFGQLVIGGSGSLVDTYDSNAGYVARAAGASGMLVSNGSVGLNSATVVSGNLMTGSTWDGDGSVSGTYTPNVSPLPVTAATYPTAACPTTGYTPRSDLPANLNSSTYDASAGKFIVKSEPVTIDDTPSNGAYYFDLLSVSDMLNISYSATPNPGTIYGHDNLIVSSGGNVNNLSAKPALLVIKSCLQAGDASTFIGHKFDFSGGGSGYLQIYAPNMDVSVGGGGDFYGAIIGGGNGQKITINGGSRLHYDTQLSGAANLRARFTGGGAEHT